MYIQSNSLNRTLAAVFITLTATLFIPVHWKQKILSDVWVGLLSSQAWGYPSRLGVFFKNWVSLFCSIWIWLTLLVRVNLDIKLTFNFYCYHCKHKNNPNQQSEKRKNSRSCLSIISNNNYFKKLVLFLILKIRILGPLYWQA